MLLRKMIEIGTTRTQKIIMAVAGMNMVVNGILPAIRKKLSSESKLLEKIITAPKTISALTTIFLMRSL